MSPVSAPFVSTELLSRSLQTAPAQSRCRYSGQPQEDRRKRPQESWGTRLHVYVPCVLQAIASTGNPATISIIVSPPAVGIVTVTCS